MLSLLRAEWRKATGNRMLISFLIWSPPVGLAVFFAATIVTAMVSERMALAMAATSSGQWTTDAVAVWGFLIGFPANIFGRLLPLAFMAVMFAGEYQWGTWRFVLPRASRSRVLLAKFITATAIVSLSYLLTSLITVLGRILVNRVIEHPYGPALSPGVLVDFLVLYAQHLLIGLLALLILAGFAALSSLLTRSILGGLLASFGLSVVEPMSLVLLLVLGRILDRPEIGNLYQYSVSYNLDNARAWFLHGQAIAAPLAGFTAEYSLAGSLLALVVWVLILFGLSALIFGRQDVTS
jgi:ABC-type transport system involved in multi-copper enzyme maturation permease subunit